MQYMEQRRQERDSATAALGGTGAGLRGAVGVRRARVCCVNVSPIIQRKLSRRTRAHGRRAPPRCARARGCLSTAPHVVGHAKHVASPSTSSPSGNSSTRSIAMPRDTSTNPEICSASMTDATVAPSSAYAAGALMKKLAKMSRLVACRKVAVLQVAVPAREEPAPDAAALLLGRVVVVVDPRGRGRQPEAAVHKEEDQDAGRERQVEDRLQGHVAEAARGHGDVRGRAHGDADVDGRVVEHARDRRPVRVGRRASGKRRT